MNRPTLILKPTKTAQPLYAHTYQGNVFYAVGGKHYQSSLSPEQFATEMTKDFCYLRLMGTQANAKLISSLCSSKSSGWPGKVEVCSPLASKSVKSRLHPDTAIRDAMRYGSLPTSVGGWHEVDCHDCHTYKMVDEIDDRTPDKRISELVRQHMVWPLVSFLSPLDDVSVGRLIVAIVDPRWFVDPEHPGRTAKLEAHFYLNPNTQYAAFRGFGDAVGIYKCLLVQCCWDTGRSPDDLDDPRAVMWSVCYNKCGESYLRTLRASKFFLSFFRSIWLHQIYRRSGRRLFVPEYFFKSAKVAAAFREHAGDLV